MSTLEIHFKFTADDALHNGWFWLWFEAAAFRASVMRNVSNSFVWASGGESGGGSGSESGGESHGEFAGEFGGELGGEFAVNRAAIGP